MKGGDFIIYCGRNYVVVGKRVGGSIDVEAPNGDTITLPKNALREYKKASCWYKPVK